ncbi:MAG: PQQ-binding-like beta-propeller repeat protein [Pirellulales bacterium]
MSVALADDWPHWRGPNRSDAVDEPSGWKDGAWPIGKAIWHADVGEGSSSPLVVGDRVYAMGWRADEDTVRCLDAQSGKTIWSKSYAAPRYGRVATGDEGFYSGPSSTPEFDLATGYLYTLGIDGELRCWNTREEGQEVWKLNLYERFAAPQRPRVGRSGRRDYGYTSSPLVHEDWLIVEVGDKAGNLLALDKRTGKQAWASASKSPAGHNGGPIPMTVEGVPCVAVHNFDGLLVVRLDAGHEGQTVATYEWRTSFANNIASPAVFENNVVITSSYNHHKIARFRISLDKGAEKVWEVAEASKVCSPVIHNGHVYWAWEKCYCLDFDSGNVQWRGGKFGDPGSLVVTSDDRLIAWTDKGDLRLIETAVRSPNTYTELAARQQIAQADAWPHVVLAGGRLYCKVRSGRIACLEIPR